MGRFIACLEACSHMQDFKESVANVARHAIWRNYPINFLSKIWSSFLQKKWQAGDIRAKELHSWFRDMLQYLQTKGVKPFAPNPRAPQPPIRDPQDPSFWSTFGRQNNTHPPKAPKAPAQAPLSHPVKSPRKMSTSSWQWPAAHIKK